MTALLEQNGHTTECNAMSSAADLARAAWRARWPKACERCQGEGGKASTYDPSPSGVALSAGFLWDFDSCSECVEQGRCPLCSGPLPAFDEDDEGPECLACGWSEHARGETPPREPECLGCWALLEGHWGEEYGRAS